jgi:hypothetical protein
MTFGFLAIEKMSPSRLRSILSELGRVVDLGPNNRGECVHTARVRIVVPPSVVIIQ